MFAFQRVGVVIEVTPVKRAVVWRWHWDVSAVYPSLEGPAVGEAD